MSLRLTGTMPQFFGGVFDPGAGGGGAAVMDAPAFVAPATIPTAPVAPNYAPQAAPKVPLGPPPSLRDHMVSRNHTPDNFGAETSQFAPPPPVAEAQNPVVPAVTTPATPTVSQAPNPNVSRETLPAAPTTAPAVSQAPATPAPSPFPVFDEAKAVADTRAATEAAFVERFRKPITDGEGYYTLGADMKPIFEAPEATLARIKSDPMTSMFLENEAVRALDGAKSKHSAEVSQIQQRQYQQSVRSEVVTGSVAEAIFDSFPHLQMNIDGRQSIPKAAMDAVTGKHFAGPNGEPVSLAEMVADSILLNATDADHAQFAHIPEGSPQYVQAVYGWMGKKMQTELPRVIKAFSLFNAPAPAPPPPVVAANPAGGQQPQFSPPGAVNGTAANGQQYTDGRPPHMQPQRMGAPPSIGASNGVPPQFQPQSAEQAPAFQKPPGQRQLLPSEYGGRESRSALVNRFVQTTVPGQ